MLNPSKFEKDHDLVKKERYIVWALVGTIRFRMLHALVYKTDIVPVILCGCEIWCLMSREEHRLRVCESRVVRRIFDVKGR